MGFAALTEVCALGVPSSYYFFVMGFGIYPYVLKSGRSIRRICMNGGYFTFAQSLASTDGKDLGIGLF